MTRFASIFFSLCLGGTVCLQGQTVPEDIVFQETISVDTVAQFRFVPGLEMFYGQYKENEFNLHSYPSVSTSADAQTPVADTDAYTNINTNRDVDILQERDSTAFEESLNLQEALTEKSAPAGEPIFKEELPTATPATRQTLFAVKTNLLYDLALTPNLELEIPIGLRWSINAEYQYGWWLRKNNSFCWQIEAGGLEGRYWLGNREKRDVLTGWFVGLFSSGGMYDFQLKKDEGRQGEFYIMAGATAGYALPIAHNLHMEFSTGVGALVTNYRRYRIIDDELIKQGLTMKYKAFLPLKAKVSLVWTIKGKKEARP